MLLSTAGAALALVALGLLRAGSKAWEGGHESMRGRGHFSHGGCSCLGQSAETTVHLHFSRVWQVLSSSPLCI